MANIVFINVLSRMNHAVAHLMGALRDAGHTSHTIRFKRQEALFVHEIDQHPEYDLGDMPQRHYILRDRDLVKQDTSVWKKIAPREKRFLIERLKELKPDAIGLTSLSHSMGLSRQIIEILRENFDVPLMLGGVGAITEPELGISFADLICTGEGEQVIVDIAERLDAGQDLSGINGTYYRQPDGEIQRNAKAPLTNLATLTMPDYEHSSYTFINGFRYDVGVSHNYRVVDASYTIMTQRGCPFSCSFCIESFLQQEFGRKEHLRRVTPDRAIAELKYAKDVLGFEKVAFWDDVFPINPEWLDEFLPKYKAEIGLPFFCYTYPSTTKPAVLAKLKEAGCTSITMGIQSGSDRILFDVFDRNTKKSTVHQAIDYLLQSGIERVEVDLIPKTPYDREDDLYQTLMLMLDMPRFLAPSFFNELIVFPNYPIHDLVRDKNLIGTSEPLTEELYLFYLKLMAMTRLEYDKEFILQLHANSENRQDHEGLNQYLLTEEELMANGHHQKQFYRV